MILEINNLSLSVGAKPILHDLSCGLCEGEFVALLGANGVGKTTLLRAIIGYIKPQQGSIKLLGQNIDSISQKEIGKLLSYVPQSIQVVFDSLVEQFFVMPDDSHSSMLVSDLGIKNFLKRRFLSLSGGERQGVLLASALATAPKLLLLDELTQYADAATTTFLGEYLLSYKAKFGLSVLAVSHDLDWVSRFTQRNFLLQHLHLGSQETASAI